MAIPGDLSFSHSDFFPFSSAVSRFPVKQPAPSRIPHRDLTQPRPFEHEVEKGAAFALGLLAIKPEHQQLIVDAGALPLLVNLLKRHKNATDLRAVNSVINRAADAITNLAHENSNIKTGVRIEGGIPPIVEVLLARIAGS